MRNKKVIGLSIVSVLALLMIGGMIGFSGCNKDYFPKPQGYLRIDLPEKAYTMYESPCGPSMEIPNYVKIEMRDKSTADSCWFNIYYPRFDATVYCTMLPAKENLDKMINDAYHFAAKHEMKATALKRTMIEDPQRKVYGILYDIEGEAASQLQFFLTDSTDYFFRGALYFNCRPNPDSLAPVLNFIHSDVEKLIQTITWNTSSRKGQFDLKK